MYVTVGNVEEFGSCNFCSKGKLIEGSKTLKYPYDKVISVGGKQASMTICEECFDKLKKIEIR
jgi:hypothetical protein